MQACPYDALYIDPDRNTAAKCNFDASRVEMGYKPACEVVCPTQAILSGDLDDANSTISKRIAMEKVSVRKAGEGHQAETFLCRRRRRSVESDDDGAAGEPLLGRQSIPAKISMRLRGSDGERSDSRARRAKSTTCRI